jgi:4-oxalocrotonate tautomerase
MPFVQVKLIEGVFTPEQKKEIIQRVTDAVLAVEGENMRQVTTVVIDEVKSGDWSVGGKTLTTSDVLAPRAGKGRR